MESTVTSGRELPPVAVTDLPALPEAALYVLSVVRKPDVSAEEVARALGSDQSIALRFLSIANSAYFATTHRITTLPHCVAWLGLDFVSSTLVALGIDRAAAALHLPGFDRLAFWQHSMGVGACCEMIASRVHNAVPGEAYLVGLCHDLGKLVLALTQPGEYICCLAEARLSRQSLYDLETRRLGLDHALAGAGALREWKLNPELVYGVLNHHEECYTLPQGRLIPVLHLAQGIFGAIGAEPGTLEAEVAAHRRKYGRRALQLDEDFVNAVSDDLQVTLDKLHSAVLAMTGERAA